MAQRIKLTDKWLRGLKHPKSGQDIYWDTAMVGLYVLVGKTAVTFMVHTRNKKFKVGRYPQMSLADARKKAGEIIADPSGALKAKREAKTFGAVAEAFMTDYASKHRTRGEMQRKINVDLAEWHDRQISDLTRSDAKELLRKKAKVAPISANRLKALISKIGVWATKEEIVSANPFANLDPPGGKEKDRQRTRALSENEIKLVWDAFGRLGHPFGPLFKMLLVTGQRRSEVGGMKWNEITEAGWLIPNERAKTGQGQLVPLSSLAREILAEIPEFGEQVFRSARADKTPQGWSKAKRRVDAKIADWHLHDLRRTMATHMRSLGVDRLVVSKLLNHAEAGVTHIYDRYSADPEKTAALERWSNRLKEIVSGKPADKVVQMRRL